MHNITAYNQNGASVLINDASTGNTAAKVTGTITQEINTIDSMDFVIYADNPGYKAMVPFHTRIESINVDGEREFYGRVLKAKVSMSSSGEICKNVVCENFLGFLQDSSAGCQTYSGSIGQVVGQVFDRHNQSLGKDTFILRSCELADEIEVAAEGETTYAFLINKIINAYGGELVLQAVQGNGIYRTFVMALERDAADINPNDLKIGVNLISFSSDEDVTNLCTRVIPYGAKLYTDEDNLERLDITEVNGGRDYLEVSSPYGVIERVLLLQDIEDAEELMKEARKYLDNACYPTVSYQITAFDEHLLHPSIPKISIRERHYVTAPILEVDHLLLRITKKTMCIENPANDTFTIGTSVDRASASMAGAVTASDLNRIYDTINTNDTVNTYNLNAVNARIENLDVGDLSAVIARINNLQADTARITTLMFGTATGNHISVEFSDSVVSQISDGVITNAMIRSLAADKLTAGRISTNLIDIGSDDGMLTIKDNTIQCYDGEHVRVQIGKDANGDYNLVLCDRDGNLLWDAQGLGEAGIRNELIVDRMVAENAAINGGKIDMPSLIKEINNGRETIKSSIITYDKTGQTLDISFHKIESQLMDDLGFNLYQDSKTMMEHWDYVGDWVFDELEYGFRAGTSSDYAYLDSTFMPTEGVIYMLSAYVKGQVFVYYPTSLETDTVFPDYPDWTRVSYSFMYDCKKGKPVFTSEGFFSIQKIKLEYGGALTEWCESAEEVNRESLIEITNVEVTNGNISFDLYRKEGLVTKTASLKMTVDKIQASVDEIGEDYVKSAQLTVTADGILHTVAKTHSVWDTGLDMITDFGFGEPPPDAAGYKRGDVYLDENTGKSYSLDSVEPVRWTEQKTYKKVTEDLNSKIDQTASGILLEVSKVQDGVDGVSARLDITAERIRSEVQDTSKDIYSRIDQTAESIRSTVSGVQNEIGAVRSQVEQTKNSWAMKLMSNDDVVTAINASLKAIEIYTGKFIADTTNFKLDRYGNCEVTGKITAKSGYIGKFAILDNYLGGNNLQIWDDSIYVNKLYVDVINVWSYLQHVTFNARIYAKEGIVGPDNNFKLWCKDSPSYAVVLANNSSGKHHFRPDVNGRMDLGSSSYHWDNVYADTGEIQTSDANEKTDIMDMTEEYAAGLVDGAVPKTYRFKKGTSGRKHAGLLSQDVEKQLKDMGLSTADFAGFVKYRKEEESSSGENAAEYGYGLRYEEYIAPLIKYCQMLSKRAEKAERRIEQMEKRIEQLEGRKPA